MEVQQQGPYRRKQEQHKCLLHDSYGPDFVSPEQVRGTWLEPSENHHLRKLENWIMQEQEPEITKPNQTPLWVKSFNLR